MMGAPRARWRRLVPEVALVGLALSWLAGCSVNPATGKRQLSLVSEAQEIEMGRQNDRAILAQFGAYDDPALEAYVAELGRSMSVSSERPQLDWTFRVLDDPLINAFALPGGYIYITRGILAHFNSEAELASVLGHEIGHVTARHSVNQLSKAQLAQIGLMAGAVVAPETMQDFGNLAQTGLGLLFLKYGRDDERQADELGLRYIVRVGYDPHPMTAVFEMLGRVGGDPADRAPSWASTHPHPEDREERISSQIAAMQRDFSGSKVDAESYLGKIDGIVFGQDPRHGYFQDSLFLHPTMRFRIRFPEGWKLQNQRQAVVGASEGRDALIRLTLAEQPTAAAALQEFFERSGASRGQAWSPGLSGFTAKGSGFAAELQDGRLRGEVICIEYGEQVFRVVGAAAESSWSRHGPAIRQALTSFDRVSDPRILNVQPARLEVVRPGESMTLQAFARRYESSVEIETLATINGLRPDAMLEAGRSYKVVQGGELPRIDP